MLNLNTQQTQYALELSNRRSEALRVFRATPAQAEFFRCKSREVLVRGGVRSGKSLSCAMRLAAIATDQPIYDDKDQPIEMRLPWQKDRPLRIWIIGWQMNHIGQTIHRLLFQPGAFRMIRDEKTGEWRAYKPWLIDDACRESETRQAKSLIPPRFIKPDSWAYENKAEKAFSTLELVNGTQIFAFSSTSEPKAGDPVDEIWIDEAIRWAKHYEEWQSRLIDNKGRIFWSSWPHKTNAALRALTKRALQDKELRPEAPIATEFLWAMTANPYLPNDSKADALAGWDAETRRARDFGEYLTDGLLMYPRFSNKLHSAIINGDGEDELSKVLRANGGQPPANWTRELILDPGTNHPAVLLAAIPPPEIGDFLVPYDEVYIQRQEADQLATHVLNKTCGQHFERFIGDEHATRVKPMGFGITVGRNYSRAFQALGLQCRQSGSTFTPGSDDVLGRIGLVQSALTIRSDGRPRLRIVIANCPNLVRQMAEYEKHCESDIVHEKPGKGQQIDVAQCLEYWISRSPVYVPPPLSSVKDSPAMRAWRKLEARLESKEREGNSKHVHIGPGRASTAA